MALTIPYPDMDFVPLDVLTAEELDQMVANIEYIANCFPLGSQSISDSAVTTAKINDGAVTSDKIDFTTFNYSTSEQVAGKWVDGKTIYKKTIDFGYLPNNSSKSVPLGIDNISRIITIEQSCDNGGGGYVILSSGTMSAIGWNFYVQSTNANLVVTTNTDRSALRAYFTVYYTKTN